MNNNLTILVGRDGRPSMKGVYAKMKNSSELHVRRRLKSGKEYYRIYTNHNINVLEKRKIQDEKLNNQIVVRWGNRISVEMNNSIVYNKSENIEKATNKKQARQIWTENGVLCPKLINNSEDAVKALNFSGCIIARPITHAKGKNFIVLKTINEFNNFVEKNGYVKWYYSEFIDKVREYRVHVGHGKILNYLEKPRPEEGGIAWNRAVNGEAFENVKWNDYNGAVCKIAIIAGESLDLDFYGADIIVDKNGEAYVLEINTSPTLASSEYSMERYAKYFDWLCKTNKRREHWEFKEFQKTSNYAWHDYHFEDREPNKL